MASAALVTAGVAAALLLVVVGVDVALTTTYALEVWTGAGWRELARAPMSFEERPYATPYGNALVSANASEDVRFRLRVDNGFPRAATEEWRALLYGEEVASGAIDVASRGSSETEFTVPASRLFAPSTRGPEPYAKPINGTTVGVDMIVEIGEEPLYAYFQVQEVSR